MKNQNESPLRIVKHMKVYCKPTNHFMKRSKIKIKLNYISDPPVVWLGMETVTVNESKQVLLICNHNANPQKLDNVVW